MHHNRKTMAGKTSSPKLAKSTKSVRSRKTKSKRSSGSRKKSPLLSATVVSKKASVLGRKKCEAVVEHIKSQMEKICRGDGKKSETSKWICWSKCKAMFCSDLKKALGESWLTASQAEQCWMAVCKCAGCREPSLYDMFKRCCK